MSKIAARLWMIAALLATLPVAGQADRAGAYRLGPRDLVSIQVYEEPDLSGKFTVNEDGTVRLPLVGNVQAEGLTEDELAARLKAVLEDQLLQRASVSVEILEFRSRPISVLGAVRQPGNLNFSGRLTLLEAITAAGGLTENHGASVHILRRASNGLTDQVSIPIEDLLVRADPGVNLPIFANDLINVPVAAEITVYLLGEVASPGAISFKSTERVTLLAALARAGGLTERASRKIRIQRPGPDGKPKEIVVRYKRVLAGEDPDPELRGGDLIIVKESFF